MIFWIKLFFNKWYEYNKEKFNLINKWIIIILLTILLFTNNITEIRIYIALVILSIILLYKFIFNLLEYYINNIILKVYYILLKKNIISIKNIIHILLILNTLKNPLLFIIYHTELWAYKICKSINYTFFDYNILRVIIIIILNNIIILPIKFVLEYFYIILKKIKNYTLIELLFKRIEGIVLSVLIFTNIIIYIKYMIKGHEFIIIYIFLIIISNLFRYYGYNIINLTYNINKITELREKYTIFGFFLKNLINYLDYKNIILKYNNNFRYCLKKDYVWNSFLKYIDNEKLSTMIDINSIFGEIKNKPSVFFYIKLSLLFENGSTYILKWYDLSLHKESFNDKDYWIFFSLYEIDKLKIKLALFLIWNLDTYHDYSCFENIKLMENYQDYSGELDFNFQYIKNINNRKKDFKNYTLPFFDYDNNPIFWNKLFQYCDVCNYSNNNYEELIQDGINLWRELNLSDDEELLEKKRKEWFFLYIKELRNEWLKLKIEKNPFFLFNLLIELEILFVELESKKIAYILNKK
jgi:hypothetical protein